MSQWFVLKGESQLGPYTKDEMIQLKQEGTLFQFDLVWSPELQEWTPSSKVMSLVSDTNSPSLLRRVHRRVNAIIPIMCFFNDMYAPGETLTLSVGGARIKMANPTLLPGDIIKIYIRNNDSENALILNAEVRDKEYKQDRFKNTSCLNYIIKFIDLKSEQTELLRRILNGYR